MLTENIKFSLVRAQLYKRSLTTAFPRTFFVRSKEMQIKTAFYRANVQYVNCLQLVLSLSPSVKDLLYTPAAEEEIKTLLNRLDETVGKIPTQEVLAPSETHGHVPQVLP